MRKRAIAATMLLTAAMAFTSCAKLYEEETTETLKRPQTDTGWTGCTEEEDSSPGNWG